MNRILFLSNDPVLKQKNIDVLAQGGFDVTEASDALDALLLVNRNGFNTIIIDEKLSDIDGYRACKKIREYSGVPIILLGTELGETVWGKVDDLGFDIYLKKPLSPRELMAFTKAIIKRTQPQKSPREVKLDDIHAEPTLVGKAADQMRTEPSVIAPVARVATISQETRRRTTVSAPVESTVARIADLERQLANIKAAIVRIGQLQNMVEEAKASIQQRQQDLRAVENQLQEIRDQLGNIWGSFVAP